MAADLEKAEPLLKASPAGKHRGVGGLGFCVLLLGGSVGAGAAVALRVGLKSTPMPAAVALGVVLGLAVAAVAFVLALSHDYHRMMRGHVFDLDPILGQPRLLERAFVSFMTRLNSADVPSLAGKKVSLKSTPSPYIASLGVLRNSDPQAWPDAKPLRTGSILVISTIRMGFGHYRLAYATSSWALARGCNTYLHDLLNIDSEEREFLKNNDEAYRAASKMVSEVGGPFEKLWGILTTSQVNCRMQLRNFWNIAHMMRPLTIDIPKDTPLICTHCLAGLTAVACGFTKVINLVVDNHAKWDVVVPGAINLVQGPKMYLDLLQIGVPKENLRFAGHWIPRELVLNIARDCKARIRRAQKGAPLRLLVPVGGAGAQKKFVTELVQGLRGLLSQQRCELILNAGDHAELKKHFEAVLKRMPQITTKSVGTAEELQALRSSLEAADGQGAAQVTVLGFQDYFSAVTATDLLCAVSDVLVTKPSELAFYPVPKLHIRRLGDHEEASASRSAELGDGTLEARTPPDAVEAVGLLQRVELLEHMNNCIIRNGAAGLYNGCQVAVDLASSI